MKDLNLEFISACANSEISEIEELWQLKGTSYYELSTALLCAANRGNIVAVDFLLDKVRLSESLLVEICKYNQLPMLKHLSSKFNCTDIDEALIWAVINENLDIMHYLLTSSNLKKNANIKNPDILKSACQSLLCVQYLLTSKDLTVHASINAGKGCALIEACKEDCVEVVKYMLTSPELKEHANIHLRGDGAFKVASENVLKYLIYEYYIPITKEIKKHIAQTPKVEKMFSKRLLKEKMDKELCSHAPAKSRKI